MQNTFTIYLVHTLAASLQSLRICNDFWQVFLTVSVILPGFSPQVGAAVHAGNVENSNTL